ncbi:MAG: hypothetical protein CM15mP106_6620 [Candidatus Neomarinimicrobiota bacterium]|nr:MAG: hypothetical protein CM15mP106_6620 [Candidatus Neomarinimicrobiota bacterium]
MFWALLLIIPFSISQGLSITLYELLHVGLLEYVPFLILLLSLYTISGGVQLKGSLVGTPTLNTIIIFIGTSLASWMGTTGAAMLLIRPLIRANKHRKNKVHIIVFFIFLVANIGGSLTPLGDPPLFLGFLKGVDFFWTTSAMFLPMLFMVVSLLIIFFGVDTYFYRKESPQENAETENEKLRFGGLFQSSPIGRCCRWGIIVRILETSHPHKYLPCPRRIAKYCARCSSSFLDILKLDYDTNAN